MLRIGLGLDGISPDRSISRSPSGDNNELLILARYRLNIHSIIDGISLMNDHYDNDDQDEMKKGPVNRAVGIG